jgi:hypothetical protein
MKALLVVILVFLLYGLTTSWTVQESNSDGDEILCTRPDRLWGPPSLLYRSLLAVKWPVRGVDRPPPSSA